MPKLCAKFKYVPYCNNQLFILLLIEKSFSYFLPNQIERKFVEKFLLGVFTLDVSSSVIYTVNTCTKHSLGRGGGLFSTKELGKVFKYIHEVSGKQFQARTLLIVLKIVWAWRRQQEEVERAGNLAFYKGYYNFYITVDVQDPSISLFKILL